MPAAALGRQRAAAADAHWRERRLEPGRPEPGFRDQEGAIAAIELDVGAVRIARVAGHAVEQRCLRVDAAHGLQLDAQADRRGRENRRAVAAALREFGRSAE